MITPCLEKRGYRRVVCRTKACIHFYQLRTSSKRREEEKEERRGEENAKPRRRAHSSTHAIHKRCGRWQQAFRRIFQAALEGARGKFEQVSQRIPLFRKQGPHPMLDLAPPHLVSGSLPEENYIYTRCLAMIVLIITSVFASTHVSMCTPQQLK